MLVKKYGVNKPDAERAAQGKQVRLDLFLADGSRHPHAGSFSFAGREINAKTGTLLIENHTGQSGFGGNQAGAHARRARAHDHGVENLVIRSGRNRSPHRRDPLHDIAALLHRVVDQGEAAQFPRDPDARNVGLVVIIQQGNVVAFGDVAQAHLDGADGASLGTFAVADAADAVDHHGLPHHDTQHITLRTGRHASAAADAGPRVDQRVLARGFVHPEFAGLLQPLGITHPLPTKPNRIDGHAGDHQRQNHGPYQDCFHACPRKNRCEGNQNRWRISRNQRRPAMSSPQSWR